MYQHRSMLQNFIEDIKYNWNQLTEWEKIRMILVIPIGWIYLLSGQIISNIFEGYYLLQFVWAIFMMSSLYLGFYVGITNRWGNK